VAGVTDILRRILGRGTAGRTGAARAVPHQPGDWPLIVVGMHRSGTSFLTGSLHIAGLDLGKHSTWNPHNRKGNRENGDIVAFHDAVLAARDAAWDRPPAAEVVWTPEERAEAQRLAAAYDRSGPWGFKDPRTLLMIGEWRKLCPGARFVGIYRNPAAVARSLMSRSPITEAEAHALWADYNRRLLALHDAQPFPILSFDAPEAELQDRLNAVLRALKLAPLSREVFFSADLKHHEAAREAVPEALAPILAALEARRC
jgi:hypothetical protein